MPQRFLLAVRSLGAAHRCLRGAAKLISAWCALLRVKALEFEGMVIERIRHAGFRLSSGGVTVYIDPFNVPRSTNDGDVVICTHDHYDHCSPEDVRKVARKDAVIVASVNCESKVKKLGFEYKILKPGEAVFIRGIEVKAVPAYNVGKRFHTRDYQGIGVVVKLAGVSAYHAGDTDFIPEMEKLKGVVDVALLPVSGVYVMDASEAARAALAITPKVAIPMHYGEIVGSASDAEAFKRALEGKIRVEILEGW